MTVLNFERASELLNYDPETGALTWKISTSRRVKVGGLAGTVSQGYRVIQIDKRLFAAHRLAWLLTHRRWPDADIDHVDGVRSNNQLVNLRSVTRSENMQNQRRPRSNNLSGFLGVSKNGNRFMARIGAGKRANYLGTFDTEAEAHSSYLTAKREIHPMGTL